ncbi:MAG: hypothetical protein ACRC0V_00740 [Fusobacteriaceae bacterium]
MNDIVNQFKEVLTTPSGSYLITMGHDKVNYQGAGYGQIPIDKSANSVYNMQMRNQQGFYGTNNRVAQHQLYTKGSSS